MSDRLPKGLRRRAANPACACSHLRSWHYVDARGKNVCASPVCGCAEFRERVPA